MSVQSQINRISDNITAAFDAVGNKGGTVPESKVSNNLEAAINSIPSGGAELPELTNPGTATDLAEGKELIDADGNVVTGSLYELTAESTASGLYPVSVSSADSFEPMRIMNIILAGGKANDDYLLRKDARVAISVSLEAFGDATAADVTEGKTFTSSAGLKATGTRTGSGLPNGISKLDTGTYIPTSDRSSNTYVSHGLGVRPNFFIIAPEGSVDGTADRGYQYSQSILYRYYASPTKTTYGYGEMSYIKSDGELGLYIRTDTSNASTAQIAIRASSTYKLKAGVTYRWIAGVLDGIG